VLLSEVMSHLKVRPGGRYADGTLGGGGHAEAILEASSPTGKLFGFDRDASALEAASTRLHRFGGRFDGFRKVFSEIGQCLGDGELDGVLLDLGVSSPQLDQGERGFSFQLDGPLDMRMDRRQELKASDLVNGSSAVELADIFWKYGDERQSRKIARAIEMDRKARPFETTGQLAGLIERICPRQGKRSHPATAVFQALRIAVNDEFGELEKGLEGSLKVLKGGGRLLVITFHSIEDRLVKEFGRKWSRDYEFDGAVDVPELRRPRSPRLTMVNRKAIQPGEEELNRNPRCRSAQLRVFEKL